MAQIEQSTVPARSPTADRVSLDQASQDQASQDDASQDEASQDEASLGQASLDHAGGDSDVVLGERSGTIPMLAVLMALLFAASAWFFYHQGQRDALGAASPSASATNDASPSGSTSLATNSGDAGSATTGEQTASNGERVIFLTVHPKPEQMRAPAAKSMLAKASKPTKPAPVVATAKIDRQVALATHPQPVYPVQALRAREQGTVLVLAQVDVNGHVSDAQVVGRSGSGTLDRAATKEVRRWNFEPALHDGQPIVASVEVPVSYRLDQ